MCLALSRCENIEGHGRVKKPKGRKKKFRVHFLFSPYIILCATLRRLFFFSLLLLFFLMCASRIMLVASLYVDRCFSPRFTDQWYIRIHTTGKRLSYSDWKNEKRNREGSQRIFLYFSLSLFLSVCCCMLYVYARVRNLVMHSSRNVS
jgi:hypothetical protein